jgi:hypothetical protein
MLRITIFPSCNFLISFCFHSEAKEGGNEESCANIGAASANESSAAKAAGNKRFFMPIIILLLRNEIKPGKKRLEKALEA